MIAYAFLALFCFTLAALLTYATAIDPDRTGLGRTLAGVAAALAGSSGVWAVGVTLTWY